MNDIGPPAPNEEDTPSEFAQILSAVRETQQQITNIDLRRNAWSSYVHLIVGFVILAIYLPSLTGSIGEFIGLGLLAGAMTTASIVHALGLRPASQRWLLSLYCVLAIIVTASSTGIIAAELEILMWIAYFCLGATAAAFPTGMWLKAMIMPPDQPIRIRQFSISSILFFTATTAMLLGMTMWMQRVGSLNDTFFEESLLVAILICTAYGGISGFIGTVAWAYSGLRPGVINSLAAFALLVSLQLFANGIYSYCIYGTHSDPSAVQINLEVVFVHVVVTLTQSSTLVIAALVLRGSGHRASGSPRMKTRGPAHPENDDAIFA